MRHHLLILLALLCTSVLCTSVHGDQFVAWEGYEIHYSSFSSLIIPAEVAAIHGITRAKNRIVTNISIRQGKESVPAKIKGTAENLVNQSTRLEFSEVTEQGAVYYLTNQVINERDRINFSIDIQPVDSPKTYHLKFLRQYE